MLKNAACLPEVGHLGDARGEHSWMPLGLAGEGTCVQLEFKPKEVGRRGYPSGQLVNQMQVKKGDRLLNRMSYKAHIVRVAGRVKGQ